MSFRRIVAVLLCALICGLTASAQIAADVRGRVLDPLGRAVAKARVDLAQTGTNTRISTMSSDSGDYSFTNLTPGVYQLEVSARGFAHLERAGVRAIVGQTVSVDLQLQIGGGQQTVKVRADAPLLQSATSNVQTNIAGSTVIAMPLNTRK